MSNNTGLKLEADGLTQEITPKEKIEDVINYVNVGYFWRKTLIGMNPDDEANLVDENGKIVIKIKCIENNL